MTSLSIAKRAGNDLLFPFGYYVVGRQFVCISLSSLICVNEECSGCQFAYLLEVKMLVGYKSGVF